MKIIRTFFNYLRNEKFMEIGNFHKQFYVRREELPIITLLPGQLKFLMHDQPFEKSLTRALQRTKDIFVLGCLLALRCSDLFNIQFSDIEKANGNSYLNVKSIKTGTVSLIKLSDHALSTIDKFRAKAGKRKTILPPLSKNQLNKNIKAMARKAGWTDITGKKRNRRGQEINIYKHPGKSPYRFCDLLSSHTMRRTAITTMLMLGVPDYVAKKISGHAPNSTTFYRYVNLVQSYLDSYSNKVFEQLSATTGDEIVDHRL